MRRTHRRSAATTLCSACTCAALLALPATGWGQYQRVSGATGGAQPNGAHGAGVIDASGAHVVFASAASNLVTTDANDSRDVFVRDLQTAATTRVSVASDGTERMGDSGSEGLDVSDEGRFVVFSSRAPLVPDDTVTCVVGQEMTPSNCPDVYIRDREANTTVRLSVPALGGESNGASTNPAISGDGRWVVFESTASNLVADDTNAVSDVFLVDRQTSMLTRVSRSSSGVQADGASIEPSISDDGRTIAFVSTATTLSAEPDLVPCERAPPACERPFLVDRSTEITHRIPMPSLRTRIEGSRQPITFRILARAPRVAPDGRTIAVSALSIRSYVSSTPNVLDTAWIFDRNRNRIVERQGQAILSWDGRQGTYRELIPSSARSKNVGTFDLVNGHEEVLYQVFLNIQADIFNSAEGGAHLLFATTERKTPDDLDDALDLYVLDRDPDRDGMLSAWETRFGLDPVTADGSADPDNDGATSAAEYADGGHPTGGLFQYLAEGAANGFFATRLALFNPGTTNTTAVIRQLGENRRVWSSITDVPGRSRRTRELAGTFDDSFSIVVESSQPLVVDRTMTWDVSGYGSHAEAAVSAPATTWFLAEGATHGQFQLFYLLQNPGGQTATVTIDFLRPAPAAPVTRRYAVGARARLTILVDSIAELAATDVAARFVSDQPILVERAMYMDVGAQVFGAGHGGAGVTAAAARWYLAEGATGSFFDLYYLIANPSTRDTRVRVTYVLPAGPPLVREYDVARASRHTISVDTVDPRLADTPVSAIIESLDATGIVVERSMWWPGGGQWQEGHLAAGVTATGRRWALAEGERGEPQETETYVLIANPSAVAGTATLTLFFESLSDRIEAHTVPLLPNSRVTVPLSQYPAPPYLRRLAILVESDGPEIVVERAMYTSANGIVWAAGTAAFATRLP